MNTDSEDRVMIAELERIIRAEEAKPEAERDHTLIDDCIKEIAEIKGVKAEFSEEEVAQITDKLIQTAEKTKKRKRFVRLVAGIAAMFVIVTGVTACAVNPALVNWFKMIVRMPLGTTISSEGITYTYQGIQNRFKDINDLFSAESIDIYYPSILPEDISLLRIDHLHNGDSTLYTFIFSDSNIHYTVETNYSKDIRHGEIVSEYKLDNELHFFVYHPSNYVAICEANNTRYIVECIDEQDLVIIIGGLRRIQHESYEGTNTIHSSSRFDIKCKCRCFTPTSLPLY